MSSVLRPGAPGSQRLISRYAGGRLYATVQRRLVALPAIRMPSWLEEATGPPVGAGASNGGDCVLSVARRACEAVVAVRVRGRMDVDGSAAVDHRLQEIVAAGNLSCLVVDLTLVSHLGEHGVRALMRAGDAARATGVRFRVVTGDGAAARSLDERGVRQILSSAPDVDAVCAEVLAPAAATPRDVA